MRKKLAIGAVLALLALIVTVTSTWFLAPDEPPLRVGMNTEEVEQAMERSGRKLVFHTFYHGWPSPALFSAYYETDPDCFGRHSRVQVEYEDSRVARWETKVLPMTRPPWLERALKAIGW
jgi:hypothetical protein